MSGNGIVTTTRDWLRRECPLIDKNNRFNASYIGAQATEYTIRSAGDSHKPDVLGLDLATWNLTFEARLPFGAAVSPNVSAADYFERLSAWIRAQDRLHNYPDVDGYEVTHLEASNAGVINQADAGTARYQLQIKIEMEEQ